MHCGGLIQDALIPQTRHTFPLDTVKVNSEQTGGRNYGTIIPIVVGDLGQPYIYIAKALFQQATRKQKSRTFFVGKKLVSKEPFFFASSRQITLFAT